MKGVYKVHERFVIFSLSKLLKSGIGEVNIGMNVGNRSTILSGLLGEKLF